MKRNLVTGLPRMTAEFPKLQNTGEKLSDLAGSV